MTCESKQNANHNDNNLRHNNKKKAFPREWRITITKDEGEAAA